MPTKTIDSESINPDGASAPPQDSFEVQNLSPDVITHIFKRFKPITTNISWRAHGCDFTLSPSHTLTITTLKAATAKEEGGKTKGSKPQINIDLNNKDTYGRTLFDHAVLSGNKKFCDWVLLKTGRALTPLELACKSGDLPQVNSLLAATPADTEVEYTAFLNAVMYAHNDIVLSMIAKLSFAPLTSSWKYNTVCIIAAQQNDAKMMQTLIDAGFDITAQNGAALTILIDAKNEAMIRQLLQQDNVYQLAINNRADFEQRLTQAGITKTLRQLRLGKYGNTPESNFNKFCLTAATGMMEPNSWEKARKQQFLAKAQNSLAEISASITSLEAIKAHPWLPTIAQSSSAADGMQLPIAHLQAQLKAQLPAWLQDALILNIAKLIISYDIVGDYHSPNLSFNFYVHCSLNHQAKLAFLGAFTADNLYDAKAYPAVEDIHSYICCSKHPKPKWLVAPESELQDLAAWALELRVYLSLGSLANLRFVPSTALLSQKFEDDDLEQNLSCLPPTSAAFLLKTEAELLMARHYAKLETEQSYWLEKVAEQYSVTIQHSINDATAFPCKNTTDTIEYEFKFYNTNGTKALDIAIKNKAGVSYSFRGLLGKLKPCNTAAILVYHDLILSNLRQDINGVCFESYGISFKLSQDGALVLSRLESEYIHNVEIKSGDKVEVAGQSFQSLNIAAKTLNFATDMCVENLSAKTTCLYNNKARIQASKTLKLDTYFLSNQGGHFSGNAGTDIRVNSHWRASADSVIGVKTSNTKVFFAPTVQVDNLGFIIGKSVILTNPNASGKGVIAARESVELSCAVGCMMLPNVEIQTPKLIICAKDFKLADQTRCGITTVNTHAQRPLTLTHEYRTSGVFEIVEVDKISSPEREIATPDTAPNIIQKSIALGKITPEYVNAVHATIQAKELTIVTPTAANVLGDESSSAHPELIVVDGTFKIYALEFDCQKGNLHAKNGMIYVPRSKIGRLMQAPDMDIVVDFGGHVGYFPVFNAWGYADHSSIYKRVNPVSYSFLDKLVNAFASAPPPGFLRWNVSREERMAEIARYFNSRTLIMPKATSNGTLWRITENLNITGTFEQYGDVSTKSLRIDSKNMVCVINAGKIYVEENAQLFGKFNFTRYFTDFVYDYSQIYADHMHNLWSYAGEPMADPGEKHKYATFVNWADLAKYWTHTRQHKIFCNSEASELIVNGQLSGNMEFTNHASLISAASQAPDAIVKIISTNNFTSDLPESFRHLAAVVKTEQNFIAKTGINGEVVIPLEHGKRTNGVVSVGRALVPVFGAVELGEPITAPVINKPSLMAKVMPALSSPPISADSAAAIVAKTLEAITPTAIATNILTHKVVPGVEFPLKDLSDKPINQYAVNLTQFMQIPASINSRPRFEFEVKERFGDNDSSNQQFYFDIMDSLILKNADNIFGAIRPPAVFRLSPNLLVKHIMSECARRLKHTQTIDALYVQDLHRAIAVYAKTKQIHDERFVAGLVRGQIPAPMIFYYAMRNIYGIDVLLPVLYLPTTQLDLFMASFNTVLKAHTLLMYPASYTHEELKHLMTATIGAPALADREANDALAAQRALSMPKVMQEGAGSSLINNAVIHTTSQAGIVLEGGITNRGDIYAEEDLLLASLFDDVNIESVKARLSLQCGNCSVTYETMLNEARVIARRLKIFAGNDVKFEGASAQSDDDIDVVALNRIFVIPVPLLYARLNVYREKRKTTYVREEQITQSSSSLSSLTGNVNLQSGNQTIVLASEINAEVFAPSSEHGEVVIGGAPETHSRSLEINESKRRITGNKKIHSVEHTTSTKLKPTTINAKTFKPSSPVAIKLQGVVSTAEVNVLSCPDGEVSLLLSRNTLQITSQQAKSSLWWQKTTISQTEQVTYSTNSFIGRIEIDAKAIKLEKVRGKAIEFLSLIENKQDATISYQSVDEYFHHYSKTKQGPGVGLTTLVALAAAIATQGVAGGWASSLLGEAAKGTLTHTALSATFSSLCVQSSVALLNNQGNPLKAIKALANEKLLISAASAALSAGILHKVCEAIQLPVSAAELKSFEQKANFQIARAAVTATLNMSLHGQDMGEAVLGAVVDSAVNIVSIGIMTKAEITNPNYYKLMQVVLGAGQGAINNGADGALIGALSGLISAVLPDMLPEGLKEKSQVSDIKSAGTEKSQVKEVEDKADTKSDVAVQARPSQEEEQAPAAPTRPKTNSTHPSQKNTAPNPRKSILKYAGANSGNTDKSIPALAHLEPRNRYESSDFVRPSEKSFGGKVLDFFIPEAGAAEYSSNNYILRQEDDSRIKRYVFDTQDFNKLDTSFTQDFGGNLLPRHPDIISSNVAEFLSKPENRYYYRVSVDDLSPNQRFIYNTGQIVGHTVTAINGVVVEPIAFTAKVLKYSSSVDGILHMYNRAAEVVSGFKEQGVVRIYDARMQQHSLGLQQSEHYLQQGNPFMAGFKHAESNASLVVDAAGLMLFGYGMAKSAPKIYNLAKLSRTANRAIVADVAGVNVLRSSSKLDLSRASGRTGGNAAHHVEQNHKGINLQKPKQDVFYGDPIGNTEKAWHYAQKNNIKPIFDGKKDIYIIPHGPSGYAGGYQGQLQNLDYITIITEPNTNIVVTAFPSGRTPPLPKNYDFNFGVNYELKPRKF